MQNITAANSKNNKISGRLKASGLSSLCIRRSSKSTRISDKNFDNLSNFCNDMKFLAGEF